MVNVIIIAETTFYREGLALALGQLGCCEVVAAVARPAELEPELAARPHGVVLLDIANTADGPDVVAALRSGNPGLRIIALGVSEHESDIVAYAEAGATGYLTRENSITELVCTIESVAKGEMRCSPRIAGALSRRVAELAADLQPTVPDHGLSRREAEIAVLLEQGLSNQEISRRLCIALATVKNHVHNILDKLGLQGRADAAAWARRQRLDHTTIVRRLPDPALRESGSHRW
jgi:two-component system, NarL family, nitrate/nitrite response regulator NarL